MQLTVFCVTEVICKHLCNIMLYLWEFFNILKFKMYYGITKFII